MIRLNNILANSQFSVSAVIQYNIEKVMRNNTDHRCNFITSWAIKYKIAGGHGQTMMMIIII